MRTILNPLCCKGENLDRLAVYHELDVFQKMLGDHEEVVFRAYELQNELQLLQLCNITIVVVVDYYLVS